MEYVQVATFEHYALVIPTDFYQLNFIHEQVGVPDQLICTVGLGTDGVALSPTELDLIADAWNDNVVGPILHTSQTFVRCTAADSGGVVESVDRADAGTYAADICPVNTAIIVEKRTGSSGRRNRGRIYLPAVGESEVDNAGRLDSVYRAGVDTDLVAFQADVQAISPTNYDLFILHSKGWDGAVEPADPGNAPAPTRITGWYTNSLVGTQRRRLR